MRNKNLKWLLLVLPVFFLMACGGSEEGKSISDLEGEEDDDPCAEMTVQDFEGFLGIHKKTPEADFKKIIPGEPYGDYTEDGTIFQYVFDEVENVSTYINVDAESGDVEYFNILLNSYTEKELKETQKRMEKEYDIDECHNQFFMMSQSEIEDIMGTDHDVYEIESGDYWLQYWDDSGMEVHFYFPVTNELGCIMIRVIYA